MTVQDYLELQNGTDVRGVATEGVANEPVTLTNEAAANIAKAFCVWLRARTKKRKLTIAIGHDPRLSSPALCEAATKAILSMGHSVVLTGLSTTPSMFMLLKDEKWEKKCHASIMITASHLPFNRNGMKFFCAEGGLEKADITNILTLAAEGRFKRKFKGKKWEIPYLDRYAATLVASVREATHEAEPLKGKKIIVDAGNGSGGFFAEKVLHPLGANTIGSRFLDPNGEFPNHIPNPENKYAMQSVCDAVKGVQADFGIIFDTDVDRAGAVDKNGEEINRNRLIALIAAILLEKKPCTIVTDSVTSDGLTKFIESKGGRHHRFKRGYKNVINEAIRLNAEGEYTPLAIETSGHAALQENHFLDDGAYLITKLLIALAKESKKGRDLTDLIADLEMPVEAIEVRLPLAKDSDFKTLGAGLIKDLETHINKLSYAELPEANYEGCRISYNPLYGDGWALVRMSLHDPIMPINVESNQKYGSLKILMDLYYFLKKYSFVDTKPLAEAIAKQRNALFNEAKKAQNENRLSFLFK